MFEKSDTKLFLFKPSSCSTKRSSGHVQCNCDNTAKNFPLEVQNYFPQSPILFMKVFVFSNYSSYNSAEHGECSFEESANFFVKTPKYDCSKHEPENGSSFSLDKTVFSSKRSSGNVKCRLDICSKQLVTKIGLLLLQSTKQFTQSTFSSNFFFFLKVLFWTRTLQLLQHFQRNFTGGPELLTPKFR